jgi:hypothetical protein
VTEYEYSWSDDGGPHLLEEQDEGLANKKPQNAYQLYQKARSKKKRNEKRFFFFSFLKINKY